MKTGDKLSKRSKGERVIVGGYLNSYLEMSRLGSGRERNEGGEWVVHFAMVLPV